MEITWIYSLSFLASIITAGRDCVCVCVREPFILIVRKIESHRTQTHFTEWRYIGLSLQFSQSWNEVKVNEENDKKKKRPHLPKKSHMG